MAASVTTAHPLSQTIPRKALPPSTAPHTASPTAPPASPIKPSLESIPVSIRTHSPSTANAMTPAWLRILVSLGLPQRSITHDIPALLATILLPPSRLKSAELAALGARCAEYTASYAKGELSTGTSGPEEGMVPAPLDVRKSGAAQRKDDKSGNEESIGRQSEDGGGLWARHETFLLSPSEEDVTMGGGEESKEREAEQEVLRKKILQEVEMEMELAARLAPEAKLETRTRKKGRRVRSRLRLKRLERLLWSKN